MKCRFVLLQGRQIRFPTYMHGGDAECSFIDSQKEIFLAINLAGKFSSLGFSQGQSCSGYIYFLYVSLELASISGTLSAQFFLSIIFILFSNIARTKPCTSMTPGMMKQTFCSYYKNQIQKKCCVFLYQFKRSSELSCCLFL